EEAGGVKTAGPKPEVVTTEDVKAEGDKAKGDKAVADKAEDGNAEEANADPDLKYASHDLGEMKEGVSFRIRGKILDEASVFSVHFLLENVTQDCALRLLALVEENLIARYYKDNHNWGPEEDYSQSPYKLVPGKIVAIEVLITEPGFYIAVNGFHVCIFKHHFPYTHIKAIEIRGDIDLAYVERKFVFEYPQRSARSSHFGRIVGSGKLESDDKKEEKPQVENKKSEEKKEEEGEEGEGEKEEDLFDEIEFYEIVEQPLPKTQYVRKAYLPLPYFVCFERGFFDLGFSLVISGRVRSQALHMNVSLLTGSHRWPAPGTCYDVAFKFYNSKEGEKAPVLGENEEAIDTKSKEDLNLVIVRGKKGYETKTNKKSLKTRPYKINPKYMFALCTSFCKGEEGAESRSRRSEAREESTTPPLNRSSAHIETIKFPLREGLSFQIRGRIKLDAISFIIDFPVDNKNGDIALRIVGDVHGNLVSRLSRRNREWSERETSSKSRYKLAPGKNFMIEVLTLEDSFKVAVNGFHTSSFYHDFRLKDIKMLDVHGDVSDVTVEQKFVQQYPKRPARSSHFEHLSKREGYRDQSDSSDIDEFEDASDTDMTASAQACSIEKYLPVPYYASFDKKFFAHGFMATITGRARRIDSYFAVVFQTGTQEWPYPEWCFRVMFQYYCSQCGASAPLDVDEDEEPVDVQINSEMRLTIKRGRNEYRSTFNGRSLRSRPFKSDPDSVDTILIFGDILKLCDTLKGRNLLPENSIDNFYLEEAYVKPVYETDELRHLSEGLSFAITGKALPKAEGFAVDFRRENLEKDIALRVTVLANRNLIARNSRKSLIWGADELDTEIAFKLQPGKYIQLQILVTNEAFLVALNGFHIAKYTHRTSLENIDKFLVHGCVANVSVEQKFVDIYPQTPDKTLHIERVSDRSLDRDDDDVITVDDDDDVFDTLTICPGECEDERYLPLPYYATFDSGFFRMRYSIFIKGRVRSRPKQLTINLQAGARVWPPPTVILSLQLIFQKIDENVNTDEAKNEGSVTQGDVELSPKVTTNLQPGSNFELEIVRKLKCFEIFLNEQSVKKSAYTLSPKQIDTIYVYGDVKLFDIEIVSD
uniref:Galectin domain-containing protein n=1 Tax=Glossina austeni TaxID=7395 RepID=A0A1A9VQ06_GLOAU